MVLLIAAVAPVALLFHFFYIRDKYEPEPLGQVMKVYFISFLTVIPAAWFESSVLVPEEFGLFGLAISTFCVIAFSEEIVKYLALRFIAVPHRSFNEVYDGILYGVAAALGFATVENLGYVFFSGDQGILVALLRSILAVPGHALWGVMMGYYVGLAKFETDPAKRRNLVWTGILTAIFWHGLYDFFAFGVDVVQGDLSTLFGIGVFAVILVNWIIALQMIRKAQRLSVFRRPNPIVNPLQAFHRGIKFCHQCGKPARLNDGHCANCGYRFPVE